MKEISVPCRRGDTDGLLACLRGKVFHVTSLSTYKAILETGKIQHNHDGRFEVHPGSEQSFGRLMGYVCLFDLRVDPPDLNQILKCYNFLGPFWFRKKNKGWIVSELVYLILDPSCHDRIIPNSLAHAHSEATGQFLQKVPHAEVWIEDHVPLDWIGTVILTKLTKRAPASNSLASLTLRAVQYLETGPNV